MRSVLSARRKLNADRKKPAKRNVLACAALCASLSAFAAAARAADEVSVGLILPLSGPRASIGEDAAAGAKLALESLQQEKQPGAETLKLIFEDSQGDPRQGVSAYKKLLQNGARIIVTQNSNVSLPISLLVNADRVIQLAISTTVDSYSRPDDFTFRLNGPSRLEAQYMAQTILAGTKDRGSRLAVLTMDDSYPMGLNDRLLQELADKGVSPVYRDTFFPREFDFRALLTKLRTINPSTVVLLSYQTEAGYFVKQAAEVGLKPEFVLTCVPVNNTEFFQTAGPAAEGTYVTYIKANTAHPAAAAFQKSYGRPVNFFSSNGYDSIILTRLALEQCRFTPDPACLKQALFSIKNFNGLSGRKGFDDRFGDMSDDYALLRAKDGKFIPAETPTSPSPQ